MAFSLPLDTLDTCIAIFPDRTLLGQGCRSEEGSDTESAPVSSVDNN